jgi:PAS domain S-box-containing protein
MNFLPESRTPSHSARTVLLRLSLAVALLLVSAVLYDHWETGRMFSSRAEDLEVISGHKADQVAMWMKERRLDALRIANSISREGFGSSSPFSALDRRTNQALQQELKYGPYCQISVLDPEGRNLVSLSSEGRPASMPHQGHVKRAMASETPVFGMVHRDSEGNPRVNLLCRVQGADTQPAWLLQLGIPVRESLNPILDSWPVASSSAETLLSLRQGDEVVIINQLKFRNGAELARYPISDKTLPSVQANLGRRGLYQGVDYRGREILAFLREIPGSDWCLVVKVDRDELMAVAHRHTMTLAIGVTGMLILLGWLAVSESRKRSARLESELLKSRLHERELRDEFKTMLYSIGDAVITTDVNGRVRAMNQVAEKLTGWGEAEAQNRPLEEVFRIINENSRASVETPVAQVLRKGVVVGLANHTLLVSRDGREWPIADSAAPIRENEAAPVSGVILVFRDQTDDHEAQRRIVESEQYLSITLDSIGEGVITTDTAGRITRMNPKAEHMTDWTEEEALGHPLTSVFVLVNTRTRMSCKDPVSLVLEKGETVGLANHTSLLSRSGKEFQISDSAAPIRSPDGRTLGVVLVFRDVSEQYRLQAALEHRVLALTQPLNEGNPLQFEDLFNLEDLQRIQDSYAKATGVAALITRPDGTPITKPSNFSKLCGCLIRGTEKGLNRCMASNRALNLDSTPDHNMHACINCGLWDAGASIFVGGQHMANWLVGQVRMDATDEKKLEHYSDDLGIPRAEFIAAYREVPTMGKEQFTAIAASVQILANDLSLRAYQNIQQARFISLLQKADSALKENRQLLVEAQLVAKLGTYVMDIPGDRWESSPILDEIMGIGPDYDRSVDGWGNLIHPEDRESMYEYFQNIVVGQAQQFDRVYRIVRHSNGEERWLHGLGKLDLDAEKRPVRMYGTIQDVTRRKHEEAELRNALRVKEALLKEVHHRVKNNLQVISSLLRLEGARMQGSESKGVLVEMRNRIRSMAILHETLYRSDNLALVDLSVYLRQVATQLIRSQTSNQRMPELHLKLESLAVDIDRAIPCGLILNELISNVLKHAFPEGRTGSIIASLHPEKAGGFWLLSVEDNGIGFPAGFDLAKTTSLGLQLVDDLSRQIQGSMALHSSAGSRIEIRFPVSIPASNPS